jgi:hypothetical protein
MNPEISPPSNRIGGVHFRLKFPAMKKSELLRALQTEIQKHNLSTFMDEKDKIVITGCTFCRKHFGTVEQFKRHITEDVLPPLLDKLSSEAAVS